MTPIENCDLRAALEKSGLFDPLWYAERYPDVSASGLAPLDHFMRYGLTLGRDPGPDFSETFMRMAAPRRIPVEGPMLREHLLAKRIVPAERNILLAASTLAKQGRREDALRMAKQYLKDADDTALALLEANIAIINGREKQWLEHLNTYLAPYGISPIVLKQGQNLVQRLYSESGASTTGGPLISVIMPAYNAASSIGAAAVSILNQSWTNLELLIIDDGSDDGTWEIVKGLAEKDARVRIRRNGCNLGPYICKNMALKEAKGAYVTGQDADDWAHPQRLEKHIAAVLGSGGAIKASTTMMLRVSDGGLFENVIAASTPHSPDGIRRRAFISCLFETEAMRQKIGFYDRVKFAADGEMIRRTKKILGSAFQILDQPTMICIDHPNSLTNDPTYGLRTADGISRTRQDYNSASEKWHNCSELEALILPFAPDERPFPIPEEMKVDTRSINKDAEGSIGGFYQKQ